MHRVRLTPSRIQSFSCPADKQQAFLRDAEQPGLGVRATAGAKVFIFQGKLAGQAIRMTIGDVSTWTLQDARARARELKTIIDQGRDPRQVVAETTAADMAARKKAEQDKTPALVAWEAYIKARAPRWSARHKADHEAMAREGGEAITRGRRRGMASTKEAGILRPLLSLPLAMIDRDAVAAWADAEAARRPTRARLALSLLSTFLTWCKDQPQYRNRANPDACARVKKDLPKPQSKDDCLQREQLRAWFGAVGAINNRVQAVYLQALLLTGARRNELAALRWEDVDMQWNSITIRDKVEGERTIPLTPYVKSLLQTLKPTRVAVLPAVKMPGPSPWVFSSAASKKGYIQEPRIAHNKALAAAGLPAMTIHGLRRSFGTLAEWVECPAGVVAQIQGHKPSAIAEKHYRRRPLDLLRSWHTRIEGWILEQADIEQPHEELQKLKAASSA